MSFWRGAAGVNQLNIPLKRWSDLKGSRGGVSECVDSVIFGLAGSETVQSAARHRELWGGWRCVITTVVDIFVL